MIQLSVISVAQHYMVMLAAILGGLGALWQLVEIFGFCVFESGVALRLAPLSGRFVGQQIFPQCAGGPSRHCRMMCLFPGLALFCTKKGILSKSENRFLTISNWAIYPQYYIWNHELTLQVVAVHSGRCSTVLHRFAFQSFLSLDKLAVGVEESHI